VVPVGTDRALRRAGPGPRVEALRAAREAARTSTAAVVAAATAATHAATACASAAVATAHVARTSRPRERKPEMHGFDGWQQGVRADGRDAVAVAVQQRVLSKGILRKKNTLPAKRTGGKPVQGHGPVAVN
jgi:hypothetical protein